MPEEITPHRFDNQYRWVAFFIYILGRGRRIATKSSTIRFYGYSVLSRARPKANASTPLGLTPINSKYFLFSVNKSLHNVSKKRIYPVTQVSNTSHPPETLVQRNIDFSAEYSFPYFR